MNCDAEVGDERVRRFRDAALPCLDDAYRLARFLTRNQEDAEDAVQECFLRALRHFDAYRGPAIKPWLLSILRNVCYTEFTRRARRETPVDVADCEHATGELLWQEQQTMPDSVMISRQDSASIRRLVDALPAPFREAILLREFNEMSYQEIAEVTRVPVGTVMSRIARARAMLCTAWNATDSAAGRRSIVRQTETREYAGRAESAISSD